MERGEEKPLIDLLLGLSLPVIVTTHRLKRGVVHCVHGEEVSFIPLWPQVYVANKSQALIHYFWSEDRGASIGSSQIAKIGP